MQTFQSDRQKVFSQLNQIRGSKKKTQVIPFIDTLLGRYESQNVLEGFRANAEILCNEQDSESLSGNNYYQMCVRDNEIIFNITSSENIPIPHMTLLDLKNI